MSLGWEDIYRQITELQADFYELRGEPLGGSVRNSNKLIINFLTRLTFVTTKDEERQKFSTEKMLRSLLNYRDGRFFHDPNTGESDFLFGEIGDFDQNRISEQTVDGEDQTTYSIENNDYQLMVATAQQYTNIEFESLKFSSQGFEISKQNKSPIMNEAFKNKVLNLAKNNDFSDLGFSRTINYVLENGFSMDIVGSKVSSKIQTLINQLVDIQIPVNTVDPKLFLFSTKKINKNSELYLKIAQANLDQDKEIRVKSIGSLDKVEQLILDKGTVTFPSEVFGNNPNALKVLEESTELDNVDIRSYQFKYYNEIPMSYLEGWRRWYEDEPISPSGVLVSDFNSRYADFIMQIFADYTSDGSIDSTITSSFNKIFNDDVVKRFYRLIATDKEVARRIEFFNQLADASQQVNVDSGDTLSDEEIKKIQTNAAKAFVKTEADTVRKPLTDEQIESRQRFYKQCALMLNIHRLSPSFEDVILDRQTVYENYDGPDKTKPFGGRFWRAQSENTEQLMTNLVSSEDSSYMFEIPTHIMTQLTPKFRLYKVMNDQEGNLKQTEFIFPMYADIDRKKNFKKQQSNTQESTIPTFLAAQFDKGDGIGLKSFSLDFNGTNPAEARNDVKGSMSLFFQSFADFTRTRIDPNGNEYRFVDLIIQPTPDKNNRVDGIKLVSLKQYEPTFYRIRVDMGYNIPQKGDMQGIDETTKDKNGKTELQRLQNALRSMNKSYYLCMIDHSFNIKNDGTVEMNFTYRAYLETALKSLRFDALTTPELARRRIQNENKMHEVASSKKCTKDELRELQLAIAGVEEEMILNSLNSIMRRLNQRKKVFTATIDNEDRKYFLKNGFYRTCDLINGVSLDDNPDSNSDGDLGVVLNSLFLSDEPCRNFERDINDTNIQFFFFGDLLHTILDALYDPDDKTRKKVAVGMENTKMVLGHFEFDPYQGHGSSGKYNISNIPISVDFFGEWFKQNILNQKSTRRTFPILNFIRNLSNHLVNNALLEACVNRSVDKAIRFQTGQISALSSDGLDPLGSLVKSNKLRNLVYTDHYRRTGDLPLSGDVEGSSDIKNFYHYIVLSCNGSALTYAGTGKYEEDIKAGRFHVEIGSNRGIVKTVNFAKTDMQYLREARFFRNGIDGLLQLSSVYTATVEMFGNTLFYPGMDLWINPYGFGGTHLGRPSQGGGESKSISSRSLANILGIGGYHTITGVSTTLTPQGFKTSIKSQHYYSGDGENPDTTTLKGSKKSTEDELIEKGVNEHPDKEAAAYCKNEILDQINFNVTGVPQAPSIEDRTDPPTPASPPTVEVSIINEELGESDVSDGLDSGFGESEL